MSDALLRFMFVRGEKPTKEEPAKKIRKKTTEEAPSDTVATEEAQEDHAQVSDKDKE